MTPRSGILAGGNWIVDQVKVVDTYPQQDALANILSESIGTGGSPFNLLVDLAKLQAGFPLAGIGLIGADSEGEWIRRECALHRIDATQVRAHPSAHTSYTDVMVVQSTGRRTFFHQRGANAFLDGEHFDFSGNHAKIFHLGYLLLLDRLDQPDPECGTVAARVLRAARKAGFLTSIDLVSEESQRFSKIIRPALPHVDFCILNEFELGRTMQVEVRRGDSLDLAVLQKAAGAMLNEGVHRSVIVHFPEGAFAVGKEGAQVFQGSVKIPQSEIVSTVGAGDAFAAGVLYGLHEAVSMEEALRYGVCAAASNLRGSGSSDGMTSLKEALELGEKFGFRNVSELR